MEDYCDHWQDNQPISSTLPLVKLHIPDKNALGIGLGDLLQEGGATGREFMFLLPPDLTAMQQITEHLYMHSKTIASTLKVVRPKPYCMHYKKRDGYFNRLSQLQLNNIMSTSTVSNGYPMLLRLKACGQSVG